MKKIFIMLLLAIFIAGCNSNSNINGDNIENVDSSSSDVYVDEGISPNIILVDENIHVIYVKSGDIYSKKFYSDLKPFPGSPVKLTNNKNIKDVQVVFTDKYYVDMTYSDNSGSYKATYSIDWGETKKEQTSEKLSQSTSTGTNSVYEKEGKIYLK